MTFKTNFMILLNKLLCSKCQAGKPNLQFRPNPFKTFASMTEYHYLDTYNIYNENLYIYLLKNKSKALGFLS